MARVLILGGSFDPPHHGHLALLKAAARAVRPDRILIVPAHHAPLKAAPSASDQDRVRMLRLALAGLPQSLRAVASIEPYELGRRCRVFTVETLGHIRRRHPSADLHFAAGWDAAAGFPRWKSPARLKSLCAWWTARRPGAAGAIPGHFQVLKDPMPAVSSTELRRVLALGRDAAGFMEPTVYSYIKRKRLYGLGLLAELKAGLKPERFAHTLAVAELAEDLALRWGQDAEKARLAGLLHDCGRVVPVGKMIPFARARRIAVPRLEEVAAHHPLLAHAYISAHLARVRHGIADREVLSAVRRHTLGDVEMSELDKILYVADSVSADRRYPGVGRLRDLARRDLGRAFKDCVQNNIRHVEESGSWIHPLTLRLWDRMQ